MNYGTGSEGVYQGFYATSYSSICFTKRNNALQRLS